MKTFILFALLAGVVFVKGEGVIKARAFISPNCKQIFPYKVYGTVDISQKETGGESIFRIKLSGLPPNTYHGFHVHESGDIHTKGCVSARGHYNPFGVTHGDRTDKIRHVGDLGNLYADENGKISAEITDTRAGLVGKYSIIGRSFVVHEKRDDLGRGVGKFRQGSLKTGNAGSRLACGIIFHA